MQPEIAKMVLTIGQFTEQPNGTWRREIPEEDTRVVATLYPDRLSVSLMPSVTTWEGHHHKRLAAGVMFEIAAKYHERVGGRLTQAGINVPACQVETGGMVRTLLEDGEHGYFWERCCPGWQAVFLDNDASGPENPDAPIAYG